MQGNSETTVGATRRYASVRMPRSAFLARSLPAPALPAPALPAPWIAWDPEFHEECATAVRALRLTLFALFALLIAPLRSKCASEQKPDRAQAMLHARNTFDNSPLVAARNRVRQSDEKRLPDFEMTAANGVRLPPAEEKPQPIFLRVKRSHGPPPPARTATPVLVRLSAARLLSRVFPQSLRSVFPAVRQFLNPIRSAVHKNLRPVAAARRPWSQDRLVSRNFIIDRSKGDPHHECC